MQVKHRNNANLLLVLFFSILREDREKRVRKKTSLATSVRVRVMG